MRRGITVAMLSVVLVAVAACGGKPGDGQVEALVRDSVVAGWPEGSVEMREFRKTNGRVVSNSEYMAWVEYDVVFTRGSEEIRSELSKASGVPPPTEQGFPSALLKAHSTPHMMALSLLGTFEAGHTLHRETTVSLVRTEKGWLLAPSAK